MLFAGQTLKIGHFLQPMAMATGQITMGHSFETMTINPWYGQSTLPLGEPALLKSPEFVVMRIKLRLQFTIVGTHALDFLPER